MSTRVNRIFSNLHILAEGFSGNNQTADRLIKKIMKSAIKFQVLYNNRDVVFNQNDLRLLIDFREHFDEITETISELYNFDFVIRRLLLRSKCKDCQKLIHRIIGNRLTQKSHERINFIFDFISNTDFLKYVFNSKSTINHAIIREIIVDFRALMKGMLI